MLIGEQIKDYPLCRRLFFLAREKEIEFEKRGKVVHFEDVLGKELNGQSQDFQPILQELIKATIGVCQQYLNKTYKDNYLQDIWQQLWNNSKTKLQTLLNSQSKYKVVCATIGRMIDTKILVDENNAKLKYRAIAIELCNTDFFKESDYTTLSKYMGLAQKDYSHKKSGLSDFEKYITIMCCIVQ